MPARSTAKNVGIGLAVASLALLGGCSQHSDSRPEDGVPEDVASGVQPAVDRNFADPDIVEAGGTFYAYATNDNNKNVQVAASTDLEKWELLDSDALPTLPTWIIPGKTWAPEVSALGGQYVMYFTATNFMPALQCIGVATSAQPTGPFVVQGDAMLVCPADQGGAIDASVYSENGNHYLLWKNDGNCCGLDTWISIAPLSSDGLTLAGPATQAFKQTLSWEGHLVEAPTLVKNTGTYYLFYSANDYGGEDYAVGYATATSLDGPWEKNDEPFLSTGSSGDAVRGPGGQDILQTSAGESWIAFHGWDGAFTYRALYVEPLQWEAEGPVVTPLTADLLHYEIDTLRNEGYPGPRDQAYALAPVPESG